MRKYVFPPKCETEAVLDAVELIQGEGVDGGRELVERGVRDILMACDCLRADSVPPVEGIHGNWSGPGPRSGPGRDPGAFGFYKEREPDSLGGRLTAARMAKSMSLGNARDATGVKTGYLSQLELGTKKNPSILTLQALARAYGVSMKYLLGE